MRLSDTYRYDQPAVLTDIVVGLVRERNVRSLLDIGAGDGTVAVPVARSVARYLAVEQDAARCAALRRAGLDVIEAQFPVAIDERFDLVVSSHSIPEHSEADYAPFLSQAWTLLAPGGLLAIITFKAPEPSPIMRLSEELLGRKYKPDPRYMAMLAILRSHGAVTISQRCSYVETGAPSDLDAVFGSWFWTTPDEASANRPRFHTAMDARFKTSGRYRVPTPHMIVTVARGA